MKCNTCKKLPPKYATLHPLPFQFCIWVSHHPLPLSIRCLFKLTNTQPSSTLHSQLTTTQHSEIISTFFTQSFSSALLSNLNPSPSLKPPAIVDGHLDRATAN
ncbi:hypothetical protein Dimus_008914 [Dionaea muscipula]